MRTKIKLHHMLLVGALAFGSCQKEYVQPTPPPKPITTPLTFTADVYPLLTASSHHCPDCHNGGQAPDFSTSAIAFNALTTGEYISTSSPSSSKFYIAVTPAYAGPSGQMYPSGPYLTSKEQGIILTWITQGAHQ